mmetsp:Transcript_7122/g.21745  ORF Transcript_7122/g.21745 Transcript_7122/m.21745 type:complete len:169 (-) Transcript_7122:255-761(-)
MTWFGWVARDVKEEGNRAFNEKEPEKAVALYSEGLEQLVGSAQREKRATLLSNRSAAYAALHRWEEALRDADEAVEYAPDWAKPWARKGRAHYSRREFQKAASAYAKGCEVALKSADEAKKRHESEVAAIKKQAQQQSEEYERLLHEVAALKSQLEDYELVFDKSKKS